MALGDLTRLSLSFGVDFDISVVILRTVPTRKIASFGSWIMPLLGPLGMGPFIFLLSLPKRLACFGILSRPVGFGLAFPRCV